DREHDREDCADELPPHYTALSIGVRASPEEVRSAYRRAALATHPDKGGDSAAFLLVVRAFEVLSDHIARQKYDLAWRAELYQELGGGKDVAEQAAIRQKFLARKERPACRLRTNGTAAQAPTMKSWNLCSC
ncbi:unnamed protein product, partial [Polarella glacialis]